MPTITHRRALDSGGAPSCSSEQLEVLALSIRSEVLGVLSELRDLEESGTSASPPPATPAAELPPVRRAGTPYALGLIVGPRVSRTLPRTAFAGGGLGVELTRKRLIAGLAADLYAPRRVTRSAARLDVLAASFEARAGAWIVRSAKLALGTTLSAGASVLARRTVAVEAGLVASDHARSVHAHVGAQLTLDVALTRWLGVRLSGGARVLPGVGDFVVDDTDGRRTLARGAVFVPWLAIELRGSLQFADTP